MLKKIFTGKVVQSIFRREMMLYSTNDANNKVPIFNNNLENKEGLVPFEEDQPVHLRAYNRAKYEQPLENSKIGTGYVIVDIDPFPKAKIMKLCYILMEKLKDIPETALYRIYTEEKCKYIMKLTDETGDIKTLEKQLGYESIEMIIQYLQKELELSDTIKDSKPWLARERDENDKAAPKRNDDIALKHLRLDRPERERKRFV